MGNPRNTLRSYTALKLKRGYAKIFYILKVPSHPLTTLIVVISTNLNSLIYRIRYMNQTLKFSRMQTVTPVLVTTLISK